MVVMNGGDEIKRWRKLRRMTLDGVAAAVGVKQSAVTKWQSGEIAEPRREHLERLDEVLDAGGAILRAYGLSVDDAQPSTDDNGLAAVLDRLAFHQEEMMEKLVRIEEAIGALGPPPTEPAPSGARPRSS